MPILRSMTSQNPSVLGLFMAWLYVGLLLVMALAARHNGLSLEPHCIMTLAINLQNLLMLVCGSSPDQLKMPGPDDCSKTCIE
eukprot:1208930-Ditylum_brightwellii.AAC.1